MNIKAYPIVLSKEKDGYYVDIPDFNSATQGNDIANAIYMARDCIGLLGIHMIDNGQELPIPNSATIKKEYDEDIITYVDIDFDIYRKQINTRKVRRNVTIPSYLNDKANQLGLNVSQILTEALEIKCGY